MGVVSPLRKTRNWIGMPWTSEHTKWLVDTGERLKLTPRSRGAGLVLLCVGKRHYEAFAHGLGVAHEGLHRRVGSLADFELR